jgi:hypothetical protein
LGITGEVYHSGKVVWSNKVSELGNYVPSIDNMSADVKDVHSLIIIPIWGHANKGDVKSNSAKPVGCMQFINKRDYENITPYDLVSF